MGKCIISGVPVSDGYVSDNCEQDVIFEFRGDHASQLIPNRFYKGTVDGYAEFGVFIDIAPGVTGLLHRSELDQRLDSLDWEPGDTVCVKVKNVRDNGNIDLGKSIRQTEREFRGKLILDEEGEKLPEEVDEPKESAADEADDTAATSDSGPTDAAPADTTIQADETDAGAAADDSVSGVKTAESDTVAGDESEPTATQATAAQTAATAEPSTTGESTVATAETPTDATAEADVADDTTDEDTNGTAAVATADEAEYEETTVAQLSEKIGDPIQLSGEIVSVRQTGGPTVFELRDETGVIDCAAFVEAGVRAYPEIELGDIVRLDGEAEQRRGELQVETDDLTALDGEERDAVEDRLDAALTDRARPDELDPIGDHETVDGMAESLLDVAESIRRAVLASRPVVIRHPATAAGYVAGAAIERAVLPLVRAEHARSDAEYHYVVRRPLENAVYDMDDATNDSTKMLQDRDRHDEKLPLFCFVGAGSTADSVDGLGLLGVYGAERIVLDAIDADPEISDVAEQVVTGDAADLSIGALTANLAASLNPETSEEMQHLPAISYWENTPEAYTVAAEAAGYDTEQVRHLREAIALEAYYQSYQDKRELITDLLFEDAGELAAHIAEQFREKLDTELETAKANLEREQRDGVGLAILDTDQFTHRFDFPPTSLLLDELHYVERDGEQFVTVGIGTDELYLRSTQPLDLRAVANAAAEEAPEADVTAHGIREGRIEFLSGRREAAKEAVLAAAVDQLS